jgi:hypothetical protein
LTDADAQALQEKIDEVNRVGRLHIQLIRNEPKAFLGPFARYGKFRNVTDYLVMVGVKADDLDERIGYYGEQLVLLAQTLGMNTCWVGLSYTKIPGTYVLNEGEICGELSGADITQENIMGCIMTHNNRKGAAS